MIESDVFLHIYWLSIMSVILLSEQKTGNLTFLSEGSPEPWERIVKDRLASCNPDNNEDTTTEKQTDTETEEKDYEHIVKDLRLKIETLKHRGTRCTLDLIRNQN